MNTPDKKNSFWPQNTDKVLYIPEYESNSLAELIEKATTHFQGASIASLNITSECIHTEHINHDVYDSSDYTNFIVITLSE